MGNSGGASGGGGSGGPPVISRTVSPSGSDDTAALAGAIDAVVAQGIANGSYYGEVWLDDTSNPIQLLGGFDTTQSGNAQVALPLVTTAGPKFTLAIRSRRSGAAGWHWNQVVAQPPSIWSNAVRVSGGPSIIGGPEGWTDPNGGASFTNYHLILDGLSIGNTHSSGMTYVDFKQVAEANIINGLGLITERWPAAASSSLVTNNQGIGLLMPAGGNNDNDGVDNLVVFDVYYGFEFADHFYADRIKTIYCPFGAFMGNTQGGNPHGAYINYWSCEGGTTILQASGSPASNPLYVGRCDSEVQGGTDILDSNNTLFGYFGYAEDTGRDPVLSGCANLKVENIHAARGVQSLLSPSSGSAFAKKYRSGVWTLSATTITALTINGQAMATTNPMNVFVPCGASVVPTYTGTLTAHAIFD